MSRIERIVRQMEAGSDDVYRFLTQEWSQQEKSDA